MSLKSKIQALITAANAKTGETDATLTDAVQTLVDGYGGGDAPVINPLSVTANGTYTAPSGVDGYSPVTVNVPQGITPSGTISITENGTFDVTQFASALVNVSGGGGSLPSSISKIDGGSFTVAATTETSTLPISHTLGVEPKGYMIWSEPLIGGSNSLNCAIATNYAIATTDLTNVKAAGGLLYSKGWGAYLAYSYLFDVKADVFGADYIKVPNAGANYLNSATYYWLAWA